MARKSFVAAIGLSALILTLWHSSIPTLADDKKEYADVIQHVQSCLVGVLDAKGAEVIATGFFVAPRMIVTAGHILNEAKHYNVVIERTNREVDCIILFNAYIEGKYISGVRIDLALLEVTDESFSSPYVTLGNPETLYEGEDVSLYGYSFEGVKDCIETPAGMLCARGPVLSRGIVSQLFTLPQEDGEWKHLKICHDAGSGGGLSGAPLFLSRTGEVVGVHLRGHSATIGCAISSRSIEIIREEAKKSQAVHAK